MTVRFSLPGNALWLSSLKGQLTTFIIFFLWLISFGQQQYKFTLYDQEQGLPSFAIRGIYKDTTGYLWLPSEQGLARFDGYEFKVFHHNPKDSNSLPSNEVWVAALTKFGDNYFGGSNKYSLYDEASETFSYHFPFGDSIKVFLIDESPGQADAYWIASRFSLFRVAKTHTERFPLPHPIEINLDGGKQWKFISSPDHGVILFNNTQSKTEILFFDSKTKKIVQLSTQDQQGVAKRPIADVVFTGNNFYLFNSKSIYRLDAATSSFTWQADYKQTQLLDYVPFGFVAINDTLVLVRTKSGWIRTINIKSGEVKSVYINTRFPEAQLTDRSITFCSPVKDGAWLGTNQMGIVHYNVFTNEIEQYIHDPQNSNTLPSNFVDHIYTDDNGVIWATAYGHGLIKMEPITPLFNTVVPALILNELSSDAGMTKNIRCFIESDDGYWIATINGLFQYSNKTKQFSDLRYHFPTPEVNKNVETYPFSSLAKDKSGNIWVGTGFRELFVFSPTLNRSFKLPITQVFELAVYNLFCDHKNRMWISALGQGVYRIDCNALDVKKIDEIKIEPIELDETNSNSMISPFVVNEDAEGNIWVGTENGLYRLKDATKKWERFYHIPGNENSLSHNNVRSICVDLQGELWIGTNGGGLNKYNKSQDNFSHLTTENGLVSDHVYSLVCDNHGMLWAGTNNGLSRFNPLDNSFRNFTAKDGIQNYEYNTGAAIKLEDGTLLIGGITGYNIIEPDKIENNLPPPPIVVLSSIKVFDTPLPRGNNTVKLDYNENSLTFEFAALTYFQNHNNKYAYQLEGVDPDWVFSDTRRYVSYSQLKPGHYTFKVKASNWDGVWNETGAQFKFTISPPWWRTWWAYGSYLVITAAIIYIMLSFFKRRVLLQQQLKTEQEEAIRLKELDTFKSQLFTNLTHEFRTPLTVILGMAKQLTAGSWQLTAGSTEKKRVSHGLELIENNGKNLLQLINQLLDLSKLENKSFKLNLIQSDIIPYLRYVTESFSSLAEDLELTLRFSSAVEKLDMDFDPEQVKQIMTNLISNALKFTPAGGEVSVYVSTSDGRLQIDVKDTGIGIAEKDLPHILDRFYQADSSSTRVAQGTGIGLAHTQELLKVMDGSIIVESELGKGTTVTVRLPIMHNEALTAMNEISTSKPFVAIDRPPKEQITDDTVSSQHPSIDGALPQLLIIEDNRDVVDYLRSCLETSYQVLVAYDGKSGVEKALEEIPDFIISDVMMPVMDGFQVCDRLKNDEHTSHIPIILLTAKADAASRLIGLRRGADAYMAKPFSPEELDLQISTLLENRKRMANYFSRALHSESQPITNGTPVPEEIQIEDAFIKKVKAIIGLHYQDEQFALPQLCDEIGMSRSQLFRKMKAIAEVSPSDLIRTYRLQKAKSLLEQGDITVAEVTYQVGFKDPSYFSKLFQEEFGVAPSQAKN